jgi:hypothetical protein
MASAGGEKKGEGKRRKVRGGGEEDGKRRKGSGRVGKGIPKMKVQIL